MGECLSLSEAHNFAILDDKLYSTVQSKQDELKRELDATNKIKKCFYCGKEVTSFCNSHHIPDFVLRIISNNGYLYNYTAALDKASDYDKIKIGHNQAGTFKLICVDCDKKVFAKYEQPEVYQKKFSNEAFTLIALKNYLKFLHKRIYEKKDYQSKIDSMNKYKDYFLSDLSIDFFEKELPKIAQYLCYEDLFINTNEDIVNYKNKILEIKNNTSNYQIFYYKKLDYIVPLAAQTMIALFSDFNDVVINNCYDINFIPKELHIAVFPFKTCSYIIMGADITSGLYDNFYRQFRMLSENDKSSVINYLIIRYSEDYFYTESLQNIIKCNEKVKKYIELTSCYVNEISNEKIIRAFLYCKEEDISFNLSEFIRNTTQKYKVENLKYIIKSHSLNNRFDIPNFLDKKYAIG